MDHFAVRIIRRNSVEGSVRITNCTDHRHCLLLLCLNRLIQFLSWVQRCFLALRVEALTHLLLEEASLMLLLILALRVALYVAPLLSLTLQLRVIEGLTAPIGVDLFNARRKFFAGGVANLDTGISSQVF